MTHQPLDGNLALQSLSIYNDQRYTFLKNRKAMLLMVPVTRWWLMLSGPCPYSVLGLSRLQRSEYSAYRKLIYGALNSCSVRAPRHARDSVVSVVSGCDLILIK